jgi:hypothetical protein
MRNAILVADTAVFHGHHHKAIWKVFAHRGMGFHAGSLGGNDTEPSADFSVPPKSIKTGSISGTVRDGDSNAPIGGVTVSLKFQGAGPTNPSARTQSDGTYEIDDVPAGHYGKVTAQGKGYLQTKSVTVSASGTTTLNFTPQFNWAGPGSGATISSSTGKDYSDIGCGPAEAIDGSQASGWSTSAGPGTSTDGSGGFFAKNIVVKLAQPIHISGFAVDPSSTCGDDTSSSTKGYLIEGSPDNTNGSYVTLHSGTFTAADNGILNAIPASANSHIRYVRFTIESDQVPGAFTTTCGGGGGPSGCHFVDLSELQIHGS